MIGKDHRVTFVLNLAAGLAGGLLSAWLFVGSPVVAQEETSQVAKVLASEEFRLVDRQGRLRALLSFSPEGEPYLALLDEQDTRRVWLGLSRDSGLAVRDADGRTRLILSLDPDGEPSLVVRDRQHKARIFQP